MHDKQDVTPGPGGVRGAQRSSAQEKIPEILTTSSIYLQAMRQIQDAFECIFILDHGGEGARGATASHRSQVALSGGGRGTFPTPAAEPNATQRV